MKETVIGTGLSGLVGTRIKELLQDKFEFIDFSLESGVDITDSALLQKKMVKKAHGLIHLAAYTDVDGAEKQKNDKNGICYKVNVEGSKNIAQVCQKNGIYLLYISTDFVFQGTTETEMYKEENTPHPVNWYGLTKYLGELEVQKYAEGCAIARIAYPFRARFKPKTDFVRKIIGGLQQKALYPMFSDQILTPTFIDDIVSAIRILLEKRAKGIYHVVGSTSLSPYDAAQTVAKIYDFPKSIVKKGSFVEFIRQTGRTPRPQYLRLSNKKIQKLSGNCMHTFTEAVSILRKQREKMS